MDLKMKDKIVFYLCITVVMIVYIIGWLNLIYNS